MYNNINPAEKCLQRRIYMYNHKICGIKPAEHTTNDASTMNNPADRIDPEAYVISPAVTGIKPAVLW